MQAYLLHNQEFRNAIVAKLSHSTWLRVGTLRISPTSAFSNGNQSQHFLKRLQNLQNRILQKGLSTHLEVHFSNLPDTKDPSMVQVKITGDVFSKLQAWFGNKIGFKVELHYAKLKDPCVPHDHLEHFADFLPLLSRSFFIYHLSPLPPLPNPSQGFRDAQDAIWYWLSPDFVDKVESEELKIKNGKQVEPHLLGEIVFPKIWLHGWFAPEAEQKHFTANINILMTLH